MGNNSWMDSPFFVRDIWSHKTSETLFLFVILSILDWAQQKVNVLLTSPSNQFRDYFIWNRIEKLVPLNWNFAPQTLKTLQETTKLFSNLNLLPKSGFPKTRDLSPAAHRGVYISRNAPPKNKYGKWQKHQTSLLFDEMASFFMPFLCLFLAPIHFCGPDILLLDI